MTTFRLTRPEPTEAAILAAVIKVLDRHPRVAKFWRQNSGAGQLVRRSGASQFMRFGFPGCPDIAGFLRDGTALFIECKRPSGRVSSEQQAFLDAAQAAGCLAFVARNVDDVIQSVNSFGEKQCQQQLI